MCWIAKNSITGITYGKKYRDIYSCQTFIDTKLHLLEYEFRRAFGLEQEVLRDIKRKPTENGVGLVFQLINESLEDFKKESGLQDRFDIIVDILCDEKNKNKSKKEIQKLIDERLENYANSRWQKNNIIRCWNVQQERFADGFDF